MSGSTSRYLMRRRADATDEELRPGEYRQVRRIDLHGDVAWAIERCPTCRLLSSIGRQRHSVDHEGRITPSSVCQHVDPETGVKCTFHEWVRLEDWIPEAQGEA